MGWTTQDFDYHLPAHLIAQQPTKPRDHCRLLLLDKNNGRTRHARFFDLAEQLRAGDVLVLNNSRVFPARLIGKKADSGGRIEVFLHRQISSRAWECLVGGRVKEGVRVVFERGLEAELSGDNGDGTWRVRFNLSGQKFWQTIERIGLMPLPPYIKRPAAKTRDQADYQTVFAETGKTGSVAAPTAGLHFTQRLLKKIAGRGVKILYVTLHVGLGTFAPVKASSVKDHKMHGELMSVDARTVASLRRARSSGQRIIAVGTTSARALESLDLDQPGRQQKWTDIFIYPGYNFKHVDALVTNFHLPRSTLLMLVSALAGKDNIDKAYREAVQHGYRFFSYGDAMFIS